MEETDIIICHNIIIYHNIIKKQRLKEYQKYYREAKKHLS